MSKNRSHRWDYMGRPTYNPPNDGCPECEVPSKTYYMGGKTVAGVAQHRWECQHGHQWVLKEDNLARSMVEVQDGGDDAYHPCKGTTP